MEPCMYIHGRPLTHARSSQACHGPFGDCLWPLPLAMPLLMPRENSTIICQTRELLGSHCCERYLERLQRPENQVDFLQNPSPPSPWSQPIPWGSQPRRMAGEFSGSLTPESSTPGWCRAFAITFRPTDRRLPRSLQGGARPYGPAVARPDVCTSAVPLAAGG